MPIQVTCPSCLKRFNVSDKFAGKTGPCPACQKTIKIPELSEQVVIHAPAGDTPKDSTGKAILNPLRRKEVALSLPVILGASLGTLSVFAIALGLRLSGDQPPTLLLVMAAIVLAIPLVVVGYWFLQNDELEGFRGRQLALRSGVCAAVFALLWAAYAFVPRYVSGYSSMAEISGMEMAIFLPLMIAAGTFVSVAALELEIVQGLMHYMLYLGVTFILAWLAGTHLAEPLSGQSRPVQTPPAVTSPNQPAPVVPASEPEKAVPKLLQ